MPSKKLIDDFENEFIDFFRPFYHSSNETPLDSLEITTRRQMQKHKILILCGHRKHGQGGVHETTLLILFEKLQRGIEPNLKNNGSFASWICELCREEENKTYKSVARQYPELESRYVQELN